MNRNDLWKRLSATARPQFEESKIDPEPMPFGFDTRVLARLRPARVVTEELIGRLVWSALPVAATTLLVCWLVVQTPSQSGWVDEVALADNVLAEELPQP